MSKIIDQVSRNLASGMSRRRAFKRLFGGIGGAAIGLFARKKAFADTQRICVQFCAQQGLSQADFGICVAFSAQCPPGECAFVLNGGPVCMPIFG